MSRRKIKKRLPSRLAGARDLANFLAVPPDMRELLRLQKEIMEAFQLTNKNQIEVLLFFAELKQWGGFDGVKMEDDDLDFYVECWRDRNVEAVKNIRSKKEFLKQFSRGLGNDSCIEWTAGFGFHSTKN